MAHLQAKHPHGGLPGKAVHGRFVGVFGPTSTTVEGAGPRHGRQSLVTARDAFRRRRIVDPAVAGRGENRAERLIGPLRLAKGLRQLATDRDRSHGSLNPRWPARAGSRPLGCSVSHFRRSTGRELVADAAVPQRKVLAVSLGLSRRRPRVRVPSLSFFTSRLAKRSVARWPDSLATGRRHRVPQSRTNQPPLVPVTSLPIECSGSCEAAVPSVAMASPTA